MIDATLCRRLEGILSALALPIRWSGLDPAAIWDIMQHDKKNRSGRVRMILPAGPGAVEIFDDIKAQAVQEALAYLAKGD